MKKYKVGEILTYNAIAKKLVDDNTLSPTVRFKFLTIMKQCEGVVENFEKVRTEGIMKYGEKELDDDGKETGNVFIKDEEKAKSFSDEMNALASTEVETTITRFTVDELMSLGLGSNEMLALYNFVEQ